MKQKRSTANETKDPANDKPLMPKATAVWLVDNTALTFEQIAKFCGLHPLEVRGIADGEVATGVRGLDPVGQGILERGEIERCQNDPKAHLVISKPKAQVKPPKRKAPKYTPLSIRQDRPDAIAWLLRNHVELADQQICKLLGTTKNTVQAVRDRTHWKSQDIRPRDPVLLGLCQQVELDDALRVAREARAETDAELAAEERARQQNLEDEAAAAASAYDLAAGEDGAPLPLAPTPPVDDEQPALDDDAMAAAFGDYDDEERARKS